MAFSFALADKAAAQQLPQTSVSYSASPADLVSVNASGQLIVLSQPAAGLMTATIRGIELSLVGGSYVRTGYSGMQFVTLRFLASCNVASGCDIFGLPSAGGVADRVRAFRAMNLATLRMFVAAGADVNEEVQSDFLLGHLLRDYAPDSPRVSLLLSAGADVNAELSSGIGMLHLAAVDTGSVQRLTALLAIEGISVNLLGDASRGAAFTPLDWIVLNGGANIPQLVTNAATLRAAGGECRVLTHPAIC